MKLIDYDKYTKKWSPRSTILLLVVEAMVTGLLLGAALFEVLRGHDVWEWIFTLALAFSSGVGTLQSTLILLHICPPFAKTGQGEAVANITN
jgi:hypothetical protein